MFFSSDINQKKILEFVEKFKKIGSLQQFGIIKDNELKVKFAVKPYETTDVKQLFSCSKSFTSMAIGKAIDNGLLDIHDKVIKFFPVENPSDRLAKMEILHLITMTTGHDRCIMPVIGMSDDPIKAFLELDIPYEPGTKFVYNSGASLILSVIINIVTGRSVDDYLKDFYEALGINEHYYESINGISLGGVGLHLNIDGLLSFGKFLLNEGVVDGKQIISKQYLKEATTPKSYNENSTKDWMCGYGYHLWQNCEGFRADGAYGQFVLVFPKRNMTVCVQACVDSMQDEIDLVYELIDDLFESSIVDGLEEKINDVYKLEKTTEFKTSKCLKLEKNDLDIECIDIKCFDDYLKIDFKGKDSFTISAGNGFYMKSSFKAKGIKRKLSDIMPSYYEESVVSCYYLYHNNRLEVVMKNHNTPLIQSIIFNLDYNVEINGKKINVK